MRAHQRNILKAGLEMPPDDWTKDDLLEYARKMTYVNEEGEQVYGVAVPNGYFDLAPFFFSSGTSYLMRTGQKQSSTLLKARKSCSTCMT